MFAERETSPAATRPAARAVRVPAWLAALVVGAAALIPRALGLADFFTIDEGYHWIGRVERFSAALASGDWAATNQTGHPGVTTMWLGSLGQALAGALGVANPGWAGGGAEFLSLLRLPLAVANSLAVVLGFLLLRRLVRPATALLGALMWALSPFLIAHSRLLHLDALLTSCMTLSVLALLLITADGRRTTDDGRRGTAVGGRWSMVGARWSVVLSGVFAGLAFLTKAPSLVLLPTAGLVLLLRIPRSASWERGGHGAASLFHELMRRVAGPYVVWLAVAALTVFALWPAMWASPGEALGAVLREIRDNGGQPHHSGNFFLGEPVGVPDARFYPAVVLWRSTPLTLIGLIVLASLCMAHLASGGRRAVPNARDTAEGTTLLALAGFALLFALALTVQAKKLDRYLLPVFPALEILAAAGLVRITDWLASRFSEGQGPSNAPLCRYALTGGVGLVLAATLSFYHPFYLSYFNPVLGGGATAERVMLVGLGEGMQQVGAWLSARPDLRRGDVLSWIPPTLAPFVPQSTLVRDLRPAYLREPSSYAVLYVRSVQHRESPEAEAYVRQTPPLYTLRMHGITYATVHQLARPFAEPVGAVWGAGVHLRGVTTDVVGSTLVITPSWDIQADMPGGVVAFVHVLAPDGQRVAQVDAPLDQGMFAEWQAGQQFDEALPVPLPPALPPGEYRVVLGLYTPGDGARLPLERGAPLPDQIAGPHAIQLASVQLP